jgi:Phosphate-induced protein 1 conserved region
MTRLNALFLVAATALFGCSSSSSTEADAHTMDVQTADVQIEHRSDTSPNNDVYVDAGGDEDANYSDDAYSETYIPCGYGIWPCDASYDVPMPVDVNNDAPKAYLTTSLTVAKSIEMPSEITDGSFTLLSATIPSIVQEQIADGNLPYDPDGIYYMLTSKEVIVDDGEFCGVWCGFHESASINLSDAETKTIHYAITGDPMQCPNSCSAFLLGAPYPNEPSGTADGMSSVLAHELAESATDPNPFSGWTPEIGDLCAWTFSPHIYQTKAGAPYNVGIGSRVFLIQQIWERVGETGTTHCMLDLTGNPGFDIDAASPYTADGGIPSWTAYPGSTSYWGGQVLTRPQHVYWMFYGAWRNKDTVKPVITDLVNNLGTSQWWNVIANRPLGFFDEPSLFDGGSEASDGGVSDGSVE